MTSPLATADCYDALIEAFRARKALLGLSDATVDKLGGISEGSTGYLLGPSRTKSLSPMTLDVLLATLALKLHVVEDIEATKVMQGKWEERVQSHVRENSNRVSQKIIERAKPLVLKDFAKAGGKASGALRTGSLGTEIMRKLAKSGARKRRKNMRERLQERKEAKMVPEVMT